MQSLKNLLISLSVVVLINSTGPFTHDTDVCDLHVGCILSQTQPDKTVKLIGYLSRLLSDAERGYGATQRVCVESVLLSSGPYSYYAHTYEIPDSPSEQRRTPETGS